MHFGATTQDIMDTGLALQLSGAHERLASLLDAFGDRLADLTERHAGTVMAGRTHGQQAVPIDARGQARHVRAPDRPPARGP